MYVHGFLTNLNISFGNFQQSQRSLKSGTPNVASLQGHKQPLILQTRPTGFT